MKAYYKFIKYSYNIENCTPNTTFCIGMYIISRLTLLKRISNFHLMVAQALSKHRPSAVILHLSFHTSLF